MDPQQRILLELSWEALERANVNPATLKGTRTGVFVGLFTQDYEKILSRHKERQEIDAYYGVGSSPAMAAGRIAYTFGLEGPALTINTACSSSLVALHQARQSLLNGECDIALAAGVNLILSDELTMAFGQSGMLARDGRCKVFDDSADGYVRSEGAAVVVLKRLGNAHKDGDNILGVIRGGAINQDGASNGLTAPNGLAQEKLLKLALSEAGISASEVNYFEAHGTGTHLGDPVEVGAIEAVYGQGRSKEGPLVLGSVKSSIGHTEAVAGLAGLIKVMLSMQYGFIPKQLHYNKCNGQIDLAKIPAVIAQENERISSLEQWLEHGIMSVYRLVRYLLNNNKKGQLRFLYVYKDGQQYSVLQSMLSGFMRSVKQENPWFRGKVLGVDKGLEEMDCLADILLHEQDGMQMDEVEVHYVLAKGKQERLLNRIEPIAEGVDNILQAKVEDSGFPNEPVVLITGGLGGLGTIFARYFSERLKARIVLMGRSVWDDKKQKQVSAIEDLGGKVIYVQGDVGKLEEVQKVVKAGKQRFGNIDMVIHSAGVMKDALLLNKEEQDYSSVLSAKVNGTIYLDWATRDESLRYFILFSSLSVQLGNNKCSDYAAANGFLDGYARLRNKWMEQKVRRGKSIAINWPYWEKGGMQIDNVQDYIQWMRREQGLLPLDNDTGTKAFIQVLGLNEPQVLALKGYSQKMNNLIKRESFLVEEKEEEYEAQNLGINEEQRLTQQVERQLRELVMDLLKIKDEKLNSEESLQTYGFDSITLKSFSEEISRKCGIRVLPSVFFAYETISKLSAYLVKQYADQLLKHFGMSVDTNKKLSEKIKKKMKGKEKQSQSILESSSKRYGLQGSSMDIAVIGMGGIFPCSSDLNAFWQHLDAGDDLVKEVPANRWDWKKYYGDPLKDSSKTLSKWGGFIDDYDHFDAGFFKVSGREAELMDPQHRLFLQTSWKAIEDAGYDPHALAGSDAGVFAGIQFNEYEQLLSKHSQVNAFGATGNAHSMIANRVSYVLDWHGPSESIDTACSSSLVAIHRAVSALRTGECSIALAGGVSLMLDVQTTVGVSQLGVLSPDGRCKSFGQGANGYVRGEGVGVVLLKPLAQAQQDADMIYGVIRASAVAHGGKANSLTAPNSLAQSELLIKAYQQAGIESERIGYVEAHATGTELGDPVEVEGLKRAFEHLSVKGLSTVKSNYCGLGSVKTNIGHLEPAAGIAGVLKVLLALKYKTLPKNLHSEEVNEYLDLNESPFYVVGQKRDWNVFRDEKGEEYPRVAGVSSFGFGGAYAHIVLEEWTGENLGINRENAVVKKPFYLVALSAKREASLKRKVEQLLQWLEGQGMENDLQAVSYTLNVGRTHFEKRCCVVASSVTELKETLGQVKQGKDPDSYLVSQSTKVAKEEQAIYDQVLQGLMEELKAIDYSQALQYRKKLLALAGLYVKGYTVNWQLIHQGEACKRVSLPTYPFDKRRYWVKQNSSIMNNELSTINNDKRSGLRIKQLHPMVHENKSTLKAQKWVSCFDGNEFFFKDHRVKGNRVLPGVAYLEMVHVAGVLADEGRVAAINNVVWARPIMIEGVSFTENRKSEEDSKVVEVCLYPQDGSVVYEVSSGNTRYDDEVQEERILHGQGKVFFQEADEDSHAIGKQETVNLEVIRQRCTDYIDGQKMYRSFAQQGLDYGESFQAVKEVYRNESEALGLLQLPESVAQMFSDYELHPSLLDGALQCIIGLSVGSLAKNDEDILLPSVPFAVDQVILYGQVPPTAYSYVKLGIAN